jgi:hypothetical protein
VDISSNTAEKARSVAVRLVQFLDANGHRLVGKIGEDTDILQVVRQAESVRDLVLEAHRLDMTLAALVDQRTGDGVVDYADVIAKGRLLPPLDHPDPAHCFVTGTGLTHLGSAKARDAMHVDEEEEAAEEKSDVPLTDSMRMFNWGLAGGKPPVGTISVQPEWFYKGTAFCVAAPGQALELPPYGLDGGDEAELVGLYVIADDGTVLRVGYALGNEFSDHVMERQNYLYLAHSKLRSCSFGPELLVGDAPADIRGTVRILRNGVELWSEPFLTGEANMSYTIAALEHHHFKYAMFRQPGDVHCHYFGTATLSFSAGISVQDGDVFEIEAPWFRQAVAQSRCGR